ncbi:bifunctional oligoribonuclease/PAP phosphatase NrnA [Lachnospiraceae bacterium 42-17]|jgi:nanoRNase/pAp phosphatase (c-di-AMP/oligoRNAs hydrolase)|nr:bifunctional oligoribonuclease/PAP phosphatase NrnA [Dorea sp.]
MLNEMLEHAASIAIGGHVRPDGDCVGSCIGLYQYIRDNYREKEVVLYLEEIPEPFKFLKGTEAIHHEILEDKIYDLFICLDCGDEDRLGFSAPLFRRAANTVCIDHHISNGNFAKENYVIPEASSTSELIYNLADKEKISKSAAEALYLGIVHDTGVFQYPNAGPSTFTAAAELLGKGIDGPKMIRETFYVKTYAQNQILGRALMESILFLHGTCIVSYIRKTTMDFYGVTPKELDGIVNHLRNTKGVKVAVFMYELETEVYKISLRSDDTVDVSAIAGRYGGGGHKRAAGLTMTGSFYNIINRLSAQIESQLKGVI